MKALALTLAALIGAASLALPATAGEKTLAGCSCTNECPLAQEANGRRSTGEEAVFASATARRELVRALVSNLSAL